MSHELGLFTNGTTWVLYLAMIAAWLWCLKSIPSLSELGWRAVPMSLLGFVWLGFGVDFVFRFPLLVVDSYTFANNTSRLQDASFDEVNLCLTVAAAYFAFLVAAYKAGRGLISRLVHVQLHLPAEGSVRTQAVLSIAAAAGIVLSSGYVPVPLEVLTVLGILGTLWIIPATFVWWQRFRYGPGPNPSLLWIFMLPGLLRAVLSPYRENLLMPVFIMLIAMLFAGRKVRLLRTALVIAVLLIASTAVITAYRDVLWQDSTVAEAVAYSTSGFTLEKTYDAKWVETLRRFHGLDSLLLTVRYVPDVLPYSDRNVIVGALLRGIIPRAVYQSKEGSTRGVTFGQTIWSVDSSDPSGELSGAAIAPSMPGDLYEAGGFLLVILGGGLWGLMLGLLDGWKDRLAPKAAAALTVIFALHCFASIERDYGHVVSTTIQYLIVMFIVAKLLGKERPATAPRPVPGSA